MPRSELQRRVDNLLKSFPGGSGWRSWHGRICHEVIVRSDAGDLSLTKKAYAAAAARLRQEGFNARYEENIERSHYRIGVAIGR
ncbi:MAG: hypothetical protein WCT10_03340 [Patescibacteria group bacterium]|jgi:hypothetical protein